MSIERLVDLTAYRKVFIGKQFAVALDDRDLNDRHVAFTLLSEDDGNWFSPISDASSYWMPDLSKVLAEAQAWCEANCDPDVGRDGAVYGWRFRD